MSVYVFSRLTVEDDEAFGRYVHMTLPTIEAHGGALIAADEDVEVLEGEWAGGRTVIARFESSDAAHTWLSSPEYLEAAELRRSCATGEMVLVAGTD